MRLLLQASREIKVRTHIVLLVLLLLLSLSLIHLNLSLLPSYLLVWVLNLVHLGQSSLLVLEVSLLLILRVVMQD